jgi:hypothetical protein
MRNPYSCDIADYVMKDLISDALHKLDFEVPLTIKYFDDMLLAVPKGKENEVLEVFNKCGGRIKFTLEETQW